MAILFLFMILVLIHYLLPTPLFILKNILHAPQLIKNLISVRKFTTNNNVFILLVILVFLWRIFRRRWISWDVITKVTLLTPQKLSFSLVVKPLSFGTILSLAISKAWLILQLDVKNVFLMGILMDCLHASTYGFSWSPSSFLCMQIK